MYSDYVEHYDSKNQLTKYDRLKKLTKQYFGVINGVGQIQAREIKARRRQGEQTCRPIQSISVHITMLPSSSHPEHRLVADGCEKITREIQPKEKRHQAKIQGKKKNQIG